MSRKPRYTTEELLNYIMQYITDNSVITLLRATDLAKYCVDTLHLTGITYQTFTRNSPKVKQWIDDYNNKLTKRMIAEPGESIIHQESMDLINEAISNCDQDDIATRLTAVKTQISALIDSNHTLSKQYKDQSEEVAALREKLALVEERCTRIQCENERLIQTNKKLTADNGVLKKNQKKIMNYLKNYIEDPVALKHLQMIGLLPADHDIEMLDGAVHITPDTDNGDISSWAKDFYAKTDPEHSSTDKPAMDRSYADVTESVDDVVYSEIPNELWNSIKFI